ncbi:MAG: class I SAM-dependent methyltransferase [Elusimicrobia bacterium]|nr:class I SAM-dependent methyltransferase [Elusimicrobiota bacterium]
MAAEGPRACPACGSTRGFSFVEEHRDAVAGGLYRLHRCGACGLVFAQPRDPVGAGWYEKAAPLRAAEPRGPAARDRRYRRFLGEGLAPGKLLDLGCGDGSFLKLAAAAGWTAVGADYDVRVAALARAQGLDVCAGDFASFLKKRAAKEFDAVVLFDVLEHASEPRELIAAIKPVLKRGGHLAVTLPNADRPLPFGRDRYDFPPHHFTRWTPGALSSFLRREGFAPVRVEAPGPTGLWFSEHLFDFAVAPAGLALARRLAFGRGARGSLTELYSGKGASGLLADPLRRGRLVWAARRLARVLTWPAGLLLSLPYRARSGRGHHLYALARYDDISEEGR